MSSREFSGGKMLASIDGGVGTVTFNQPEKRNAMSVGMWAGFIEILDGFAADPSIKVVVLAGAGDKAFMSGADISEFAGRRGDVAAQAEYDRLTTPGRRALEMFPKPVIAKIRGYCIGGGLAVAMASDLRIAADDSQFGIPAARLGLSYGYDYVRRLVALVGPSEAALLLYTANRISAAEALRIGLINRIAPAAELDDTVRAIADAIAGNAPIAVRSMKLSVAEAAKDVALADVAAVQAAISACFDSADYREGRAAFMEKRRPVFAGK